jgi:hypothetical protein
VKRFYVESLTASDCAVVDDGIGTLNPLTAAFLGLSGSYPAGALPRTIRSIS